jgi:hypothetical protein
MSSKVDQRERRAQLKSVTAIIFTFLSCIRRHVVAPTGEEICQIYQEGLFSLW